MTGPVRILAPLLLLSAVACGADVPVPDATYKVTVTGKGTDCTNETKGFQESYTYNLFVEGSDVEIKIGTDHFASGNLSGCSVVYQSPVYLEEREGGATLRWQILGDVDANFSAGGCDVGADTGSAEYDMFGTEVLRVIDSDDDSVPAGCTYDFQVAGVLQGG